jgi:hypothetical protein
MYLIASAALPIKVVGTDVDQKKGGFEIEDSLQIAHKLGHYPVLSFTRIVGRRG